MTWEEVPIASVCLAALDCVNKTAPTVDFETPYKMIRTTNVKGGFINLQDVKYVTEDVYERWTRRLVPRPGDVVLTREAPVGEVGRVTSDDRIFLGQRLFLYRADPEKLDPAFLAYVLQSPKAQGRIRSRGFGATVEHIKVGDAEGLMIPLPPLNVQQRIGAVLAAYDDLIENNRRRIALLEQSARLLFEEWFVRLRFPGHEHVQVADGVPEGWNRVSLNSITSKIGSGATPRGGSDSYASEGIPLIRSMNVYDDHFVDSDLAFITEPQAASLENVTVQSGDILLNITGASVARCCVAPERHIPARVNQHVMIVRVNPEIASPFYVQSAINSDGNKRQLLSLAQKGATREALTKAMVGRFSILLPRNELMRRFDDIARSLFLQRENLSLQNLRLRQIRDLLLPRLMNGEISI